MNFLEKIVAIFTTISIAISSLFGGVPQVPTQNLGSTVPQAPALFETSLQASIGSSDTSMTLVANSLKNGNALSGYACFTLDEGLSNVEYVCGTVSGTAVSSMTRGVDPLSGTTTVASLQFAHRRGADVKITDYPVLGILSRMAAGIDGFPSPLHYDSNLTFSSSTQLVTMGYVDNATATLALSSVLTTGNQSVAGIKTFSSLPSIPLVPALSTDAASKSYVDSVAIAGAPNASASVKGIVQIATAAQAASSTATGSTGALLVIPSSIATSTYNSATAPLSVVMTGNSGKIDLNFLPTPIDLRFGSGTDGASTTASGTTTLDRDYFFSTYNVATGTTVVTNGWVVYANNAITVDGFIRNNGGGGGTGAASPAGAGGTAGTGTTGHTLAGSPAGVAGGAGVASGGSGGANGNVGTSKNPCLGTAGSAGGAGGAGTKTGGAAGSCTAELLTLRTSTASSTNVLAGSEAIISTLYRLFGDTSLASTSVSAGSGSGGGGDGVGSDGGGGGGGSGGTGGNILIASPTITVNTGALIEAAGGYGGTGGSTGSQNDGAGGGGGGPGGVIMLIYTTLTNNGAIRVSGGAAGAAGTGGQGNGVAGTAGSVGKIYKAKLPSLY